MITTHETRSSVNVLADTQTKQAHRSSVSSTRADQFTGTKPFARFGEWGERVTVARPGTSVRLSRWLALHRSAAASRRKLWQECQRAKPYFFRHYQIVRLDRPSFFLPAGEVVFDVTENPTQVPDHPPKGVMLRHMEARRAFPEARFFFLQPVFTSIPYRRLYTAADLREDAVIDQETAEFMARYYGGVFRGAERTKRFMVALARQSLRLATRVVDAVNCLGAPYERHRIRHRIRHAEALPAAELESLLGRAGGLGLDDEAQALRSALMELRTQFRYDPVLCFELPHRPGELWFESHWFVSSAGRTYVHF